MSLQKDTSPKIPKLRFREFHGEWNSIPWGTIFDSISDKKHNSDLPILAITQDKWAIPRDLIEFNISVTDKSIEGYKVVRKGDFIISLRSFQWGIEYSEYDGICSPAYIILRPNTEIIDYFFKVLFKTDKYITEMNRKLEWIRDWKMVSYTYFSEININHPSIPEQQKIASFLSTVDIKIEKLKTKKSLLEKYKKWVMQKIFSREIRFKDQNGEDFEEWEEKELSSIWDTFNGLSWKTKEDFWTGMKYITYKQIFDSSIINIEKCEKVVISEWENQNWVQYWDFFFTVSSETPDEIWMSSVLLDKIDSCYLNSFCFWFRAFSLKTLDPLFGSFLFRSKDFRKEIVQLAQWSTRYNMSKVQFLKIKTFLPSFPEQQRIALFLYELDKKINAIDSQIGSTEKWGKGLLQQMFL